MHTPSPSAHTCTPPHARPYKPRSYGHVVAGAAEPAQPTRLVNELQQLRRLAQRIAHIDPESATIGGGMLASLVADARSALRQEGGAA